MLCRNGKHEVTLLDALLDELTDLAATAPQPTVFFRAMLDAIISLARPSAAAIWSLVGTSYRLEVAEGLLELGLQHDEPLQQLHELALAEVCHPGQHEQSGPHGQHGESITPSSTANPGAGREWSEQTADGKVFRFFPCRVDGQAFLAIELVFETNASGSLQTQQRLLSAIAEIARDFHNAQMLRSFAARQQMLIELHQIIARIYRPLSIDETAYEIVSEVRQFVNCDRAVLVRYSSGRTSTIAVSGVAAFEPRAAQLRMLEELAETVIRSRRPWAFPSTIEEPPQRAATLEKYLHASGCEQLAIDPLFQRLDHPNTTDRTTDRNTGSNSKRISSQISDPLPLSYYQDYAGSNPTLGSPVSRNDHNWVVVGALITESFSASPTSEQQRERLNAALPHIDAAFAKAVELDALPLMAWSRRSLRWTRALQTHAARWVVGAGA
ncbi:MAG: GAF domain-containing protein, partial [Pirellulaceae bacterium]|nr:GAF domain-containing protein [Pirellulaceae bacterium]